MRRPNPRLVTVALTRKEWGAVLDSVWSMADHLRPHRVPSVDPAASRRRMRAYERLEESVQRQVGGPGVRGGQRRTTVHG